MWRALLRAAITLSARAVFLRDAGRAITAFADRREGEDSIWHRIG